MKNIKNFFKRRTLIEKVFIGVSSIILISGIYDISTYSTDTTIPKNTLPKTTVDKPAPETAITKEETPVETPVVEPVSEPNPEEKPTNLPKYTVAEIDNSSFGNCIRETLHVVVEEDYTKDQLLQIAEKEIKDYTSTKKVNALTIGFYESKNKIGKGYEMGRVEYVPFGDFSKAPDVTSGDYSKFQTVNLIEDKIQLNTKQDVPAPTSSNLDKIKNDFESVYSNSKVTSIAINNGTLKIKIEEPVNEFGLPIDESTLATYLENSIDNIGSDIKTIDITVKSPSSSATAILDTSKIINDNLGKYFEIEYIMEKIKLN